MSDQHKPSTSFGRAPPAPDKTAPGGKAPGRKSASGRRASAPDIPAAPRMPAATSVSEQPMRLRRPQPTGTVARNANWPRKKHGDCVKFEANVRQVSCWAW